MPLLHEYFKNDLILEKSNLFPIDYKKMSNDQFFWNFVNSYFSPKDSKKYLTSYEEGIKLLKQDVKGIKFTLNDISLVGEQFKVGRSIPTLMKSTKNFDKFLSENPTLDSKYLVKQILLWIKNNPSVSLTLHPENPLSKLLEFELKTNSKLNINYSMTGEGIWNEITLETAQLMGYYINEYDIKSEIEFFVSNFKGNNKKVIPERTKNFIKGSIFKNFLDKFNNKTIKEELKFSYGNLTQLFNLDSYLKDNEYNLFNISVLFSQLYRALLFKEKISTIPDFSSKMSDLKFIHKSINDYYRFEQILFPSVSLTEKGNTTDYILYVGENLSDLLMLSEEALKEQYSLYDYDENTGVCYVYKGKKKIISFIQVSAKKEQGKSRFGKMTDYIHNILGTEFKQTKDYVSDVKSLVEESDSINDYYGIWSSLNEGIFSSLKNIVVNSYNKLKSVFLSIFNTFFEKFKELFSSFTSKSNIDKLMKKAFSELNINLGNNVNYELLLSNPALINESSSSSLDEILSKENRMIRLASLVEKTKSELLNSINSDYAKINKLNESIGKDSKVAIIINTEKIDTSLDGIEYARQLFSNYVSLNVLNSIFKEIIKDNKNYLTEIKEFISNSIQSAIFGKTSLPIYKVYGSLDYKNSKSNYELIVPKGTNSIKKDYDWYKKHTDSVPLMYLNIFPVRATKKMDIDKHPYYSINMYILYSYDEISEDYNYMQVSFSSTGATYGIIISADNVYSRKKIRSL